MYDNRIIVFINEINTEKHTGNYLTIVKRSMKQHLRYMCHDATHWFGDHCFEALC